MKCNKIILLAGLAAIASACADDFDQSFKVAAPASLQQYAYLSEYAPLKDYVNRANAGDFKLGAGVTASEFNKSGVQFSLASSNFDEIVAGNAMKMASCVGDDGTMDFSTVEDFVDRAKSSGLTVYGHTLAWHSQQANKWLKSIITRPADVNAPKPTITIQENCITNSDMEGDAADNFCTKENNGSLEYKITKEAGKDGSRGIKVVANANAAEEWDTQFWIVFPEAVAEGGEIEVSFDYKASEAHDADTQAHGEPGQYNHWSCIGSPNFTTEWQTYKQKMTVESAHVGSNTFKSIAFNLCKGKPDHEITYYFDNIVVNAPKEVPAPPVVVKTDLVKNSDMEDADATSFCTKENNGSLEYKISNGVGNDDSRGVKVVANANATEEWDTQFWIVFSEAVEAGTVIKVSFDYKASEDHEADTQAHGDPGQYNHWSCVGSPKFTTSWQTYTNELTVESSHVGSNTFKSIAFNLCKGKPDHEITYYFDNISVYFEKEEDPSAGLEYSDEVKYEKLSVAMDSWISGMMEACAGNVVAWDVVNEPISGADSDGDGYYDLQHSSTASAEDKDKCFYWQDYLGDIDYVRIAVSSARRHFAEFGGNASNLKLFINDYNLESWWDGNAKLKSLVNWISKWENDTVKIDGIGTQMHISCYEKAENQAAIENSIVKMFEMMAASGKLCRISELDMGYVASDNMFADPIKTSELTEEQHKKMADFYKWIVKKYFEIIPAAQRYGITQWCLTDAPANSGWRDGEPVGLWDINYNRKHAYAGFAEGLQEATK